MSAYLVLLRVEVAAFHPQRFLVRQTRGLRRSLVAKTLRLVSVALFLVFAEGKPLASTYGR